jgi:hypothetical protein
MTLKNIVSLKHLISEDNQIEDMFEDAKGVIRSHQRRIGSARTNGVIRSR